MTVIQLINQIFCVQMSTILDFMCGLAAGWSQIITGQPLDFIKTKYQLSKSSSASFSTYAKQIVKDHGILGFYRGSSSLFFGFAFTIALQFAIYESCKKYFFAKYSNVLGKIPEEILSIKQIMISGAVVGLAVSFVYCPVQYAKIQKQTQKNSKDGSLMILLKQLYHNKFKNIYRGLLATMARETIGTAFYYSTYQATVRQICKFRQIPRRFANYSDFLLAGATAGFSFWAISYPIDVIKTKIQVGQNFSSIIKNIHKIAYRGFSIIALRSIIVNGFSFATFEQTKRLTQMLTQFSVA